MRLKKIAILMLVVSLFILSSCGLFLPNSSVGDEIVKTSDSIHSSDGESASEETGSSDGESASEETGSSDSESASEETGSSDGESASEETGSSDSESTSKETSSSDSGATSDAEIISPIVGGGDFNIGNNYN